LFCCPRNHINSNHINKATCLIAMYKARLFNAWIEDWELAAINNKDPVNEARLLEKYGGLHWRDPDNNNIKLTSEHNYMHWCRLSFRSGYGYTLIAYDEFYHADDVNKEQHIEPWIITNDLIECIVVYYRNIPTPDDVIIVEKNNVNNDTVAVIVDDISSCTI
jgi:hypothetical protein